MTETTKTRSAKPKAGSSQADVAGVAGPAGVSEPPRPVATVPAPVVASPPSYEAALRPLRAAAYGALALSVVGVALAFTVPVWSPKVYGNADSARVLALAVAQLRPALASERPFVGELTTLRRIASGDTEVSQALEAIASESSAGCRRASSAWRARCCRATSSRAIGPGTTAPW
jgi:hypothetical protein